MKNKKTTGFVGLTHLGAVASISWASKFDKVIALDIYQNLVDEFSAGKSPFKEPGMQEMLDKYKDKMIFTNDFSNLSECDCIFITHDIVTDEKNHSKYDDFYKLINKAIPYLPQNIPIILMSQISVGMTRKLKGYIKEKRPNLKFDIIYFVDTLIIGIALNRFLHPERIIIGTEDGSAKILEIKYPFLKEQLKSFNAPLIFMRYESAEMTKICINLYLFNSVIYANAVADLCEAYSADMNEIIPALRMDKRIGAYSYIIPSLGVTGGHLERDMRTIEKMQRKAGIRSDWIEKLISVNSKRYKWIEKKLKNHLFPKVKNPKICIWGLAYKEGTASLKNAIAPKIVKELPDKIKFTAYDPNIKSVGKSNQIELAVDPFVALKGADCLIILKELDEVKNINANKFNEYMNNPLILDCVNLYSNSWGKMNNIDYISIGKSELI